MHLIEIHVMFDIHEAVCYTALNKQVLGLNTGQNLTLDIIINIGLTLRLPVVIHIL
jgi:hypothetical protein